MIELTPEQRKEYAKSGQRVALMAMIETRDTLRDLDKFTVEQCADEYNSDIITAQNVVDGKTTIEDILCNHGNE